MVSVGAYPGAESSETQVRRRGRRWLAGARLAATASALAFLAVTFVWPLVTVLERSLGEPLLVHYAENLDAESVRTIVLRTLRLGAVVTACCLLLAYPTALALLNLGPRARAVAVAAILLPSITSFMVRTYAWMTVLGANGPVAGVSDWLGLPTGSLVGSFTGLVVAMTHMLVPLAIFPIYASMKAIKRSDLTAAYSLGARPAEAFVRVFMPRTFSGVASGGMLIFIVSLGFFVTPALIGGTRETTVAQVIFMYLNDLFNWGRSTSLAVLLLLVVLLLLFVAARLTDLWAAFGLRQPATAGRSRRSGAATRALVRLLARCARHLPLQGHRLGLSRIALGLTLIILLLPLLFVFAVSLQPKRLLALPTEGLSWRWFDVVLGNWDWINAMLTSLQLAAVAAPLATAVAFVMAIRVRAAQPWLRSLLTGLCIGPLALPHIVLAVGLYGVFITLGLTGTFLGVALAHACVATPFAFVNIMNGLASYNHRLDLAAESLGARPLRRFRRITLPLLAPALATALAFSFIISLDELVLTLFVSGIEIRTLPIRMFGAARQNVSPELAAVGTILIVLILLLAFGFRAWKRRRRHAAIAAEPA